MRRITCFILAAALTLCLSPPTFAAASTGGRTNLSFTYTPAEPYIIEVSGAWRQGDPDGLKITCNAQFSKFVGVKINGILLDADKYTAVSGSTVVTVKPEYLATMAAGEHSIQLIFTDGSVQTWFTIEAANPVIENAAAAAKDFISIKETAKNSRVWALTFNVTLTYSDGGTEVVPYSVNLSGNNANLDGKYRFPDNHDLAGYTLIYDIKGDGSNIKEFRILPN